MSTQFFAAVITPDTVTPTQRLSVGQLISERYRRSWPTEPPLAPAAEAENLFAGPQSEWRVNWAVFDDASGETALAWAQLTGSHKHNTHWVALYLLTHPSAEDAGHGPALRAALWPLARAEAQARGVSVIGSWGVDRYPGHVQFLRGAGFRQTLSNAAVRLDLRAVPDTLLGAWTARPDSVSGADPYRLHRWTRVPDEYLERMADLQAVINDMPRGDSEQGELVYTPQHIREREAQVALDGEIRFLVAAEDTRTGELVAYSETYWGPDRAALVYQGATAVRRGNRGQGLGRWVKADMVRWLQAAAPGAEHIRTNVAEENAAMNALNAALGFQPYAVTSEWEVRLR
ncbi:GNAT family N-acetyltransferase [Deinococcus piscis]|uniref:GNAT family N-acetyltransferase n=1 Tax=Deinococcus piscis TaxID=394230 RepID=A0ABQ3JZX8_9DEIO|nr:GNAT family N-acetyltransferase [Deinococcus piscis]GHF97129.1 GNAT family N-acetyltransferase [Deinococcus piscis]